MVNRQNLILSKNHDLLHWFLLTLKQQDATLPQDLSVLNMAPIRRYLRISKTSVLECRIFLENPADGPRWLLSSEDPALPRVIEAIRPLVLPKLREENERAKAKGKKKNRIKDVVTKGGESFHGNILRSWQPANHPEQMSSKYPFSSLKSALDIPS